MTEAITGSNQLVLKDDLLKSIRIFEEIAKNAVITNQDARDTADENLTVANNLNKAIKADLAEIKTFYYQKHKEVSSFEKQYTDRVDNCVKSLKSAIRTFDIAEEEKREKERARLQAEADERARKEKEKLLKKAESLKTEEKKQFYEEQAAQIESVDVVVAEPEKKKGSSYMKTTWYAEVVDFALLPDQYKLANQKLLDDTAKAQKGQIPIPGVVFKQKQDLVSGRG